MEKIGAEGVVSVEEAKGTETSLEVVEGMQFDRGFLSPYFISDLERSESLIDDPAILLFEKKREQGSKAISARRHTSKV